MLWRYKWRSTMKRRDFLRNALIGSTLLSASAFGRRRPTELGVEPNVLFIAIDDLKPILGCYGSAQVKSPAIDAIASQGTVFGNNHCQWAVCGPSRASIMTSLMPEETGVQGFKAMRYVLPDVITIPQHFRAHGYETAACGKINDPRCVGDLNPDKPSSRTLNGRDKDDVLSWSIPYLSPPKGYSSPNNRSNEGPDLPDSEFTDGKICEQGLALMRQVDKGDKPFFLAVGFKKPHVPWIAPKKYWDYYEREDFQIEEFQKLPLNGTKEAWRKNGTEVHGKSDTPKFPTPIPKAKQK
jgi:iduronate 2-sulfatase